MTCGISTSCLFPMYTEEALKELLKSGTKTLEIFFNSPCESNKEFVMSLKPLIDFYGAKVVSIHPCTSAFETLSFFGRYERRFYDSLECYKKLFDVCSLLGAEIVVFHGAKKHFHIEEELYFERFDLLCSEARKWGVEVCQENVEGFLGGEKYFMRHLLKALPKTKTVFDVKQCCRNHLDPMDMLETMGKSITHVHLSDHNDDKICMLPGKGNFDFKKFFTRLYELGFDKNVIIELYRDNFNDIDDLVKARELIDSILKDIN